MQHKPEAPLPETSSHPVLFAVAILLQINFWTLALWIPAAVAGYLAYVWFFDNFFFRTSLFVWGGMALAGMLTGFGARVWASKIVAGSRWARWLVMAALLVYATSSGAIVALAGHRVDQIYGAAHAVIALAAIILVGRTRTRTTSNVESTSAVI